MCYCNVVTNCMREERGSGGGKERTDRMYKQSGEREKERVYLQHTKQFCQVKRMLYNSIFIHLYIFISLYRNPWAW